jgi:antitoxin ParD1/3/4
MKHNTSVSLGEHYAEFVSTQIEGGRYSNASDVVRSGLRLLEEHEAKVATLQSALVAGEESGPASSFDFMALRAEKPRT